MTRIVVCHRGEKLDESALCALRERIPPPEVERIAGLRHWEDAQASLLGWLLLVELCRAATGGAGVPRRDDRGRPRVDHGSSLPVDVSLSHSGDYVVAAISERGAIGVDVEVDRNLSLGVEERCFTPSELTWLRAEGGERTERFMRLWTLKEAYVKATGEGLGAELRSISFELAAASPQLSVDGKPHESGRWHFRSWRLPGAWLSVCAERNASSRGTA
jgi:4'-phosphopantetheinyl transferase